MNRISIFEKELEGKSDFFVVLTFVIFAHSWTNATIRNFQEKGKKCLTFASLLIPVRPKLSVSFFCSV